MTSTSQKQTVMSDRQRRNRRWMADHGGVMAFGGAVLFGAVGFSYGSTMDDEVSWLNAPVACVFGVVVGALLGYGLSSEVRQPKPSGWRRVLTIVAVVLCLAAIVAMKYLRHTT